MRVVKEATVRKNEILDAAARLFAEKGFDNTSTNDILEMVGIARGTLYHHFKSKEDIMDALIERHMTHILSKAQKIASDKSMPVKERMIYTIMALRVEDAEGSDGKEMIHQLHKPQNALMHQKTRKIMMQKIPPILAEILKDGINEGLFDTPFPLECMEIALLYLTAIFDDDVFEMNKEESVQRVQAFMFHFERILGVETGQLAYMMQLFE